MNNDIQEALVKIAKTLASDVMKNLKYDYHFEGYIVGVNGITCDVYSDEKQKTIYGIRYSTSVPVIGQRVQVRETVGVPNSYLVDFIL